MDGPEAVRELAQARERVERLLQALREDSADLARHSGRKLTPEQIDHGRRLIEALIRAAEDLGRGLDRAIDEGSHHGGSGTT